MSAATLVAIGTRAPDGSITTYEIAVGDAAQKHVLRTFNVTSDPRVDATKVLCAALIQQMLDLRDKSDLGHVKRAASTAITMIEAAQMQAVKANFVQA